MPTVKPRTWTWLSTLGFCVLAFPPLRVGADAVDALIESEMRKQGIPGLSVAVVREGKLVKVAGYGLANVELDVPARPDTVYQTASMTKQFTAAGVMLLVEDGKVGLDDPLSKYLDDVPSGWSAVTVRHLLTMTGGVKDYVALFGESKDDVTPEQIYRRVAALPLDGAPGEKWSYSNSSYVLLGLVIRKVSGKSWDALLEERVFEPLGMRSTGRADASRVTKNRASLYERRDGRLVNCRYVNPTVFNNGDGGLLITVLDMARWDAALAPGKLLKRTSLETMWTPVGFDGKTIYHYGFGWFLNETGGQRVVLHGGGRPGSSAQITRFLDEHLTVIVLCNIDGINLEGMAHDVARTYVPDLPPYGPKPLTHPPRWDEQGRLIAVR
jgi:CubicO group peptidase (beta-lactamase class C family)